MTEPYRDPGRDVEARLKDLLGRMTLEEKLAQLGCVSAADLLAEDGFDDAAAERLLVDGIGHVSRTGVASLTPAASARFANALQRFLAERTRLGVPAIVHEEALTGCRVLGATRFPQAIGLAASWSPQGVRAVAEAIRSELRAAGTRQALAPVLEVTRDPRWGRLEETCGEDPYLTARLGVAWVRGLQGADVSSGVIATGGRFPGCGLPQGGLNGAPVQIGPRELRETFVEPFAAAIREAGLQSVMTSASSVDGSAPAGSPEILDGLLRGELGFDGTVIADDAGVEALVRHHAVADSKGAAAVLALAAGVDLEQPGPDCFGQPLRSLVASGKADAALVDRAVRRVLKAKLTLGLFDEPYVDEAAAGASFGGADARQLARRLAEQSVVLLANDGVLPLANGCRCALLGPAADDPRLLLARADTDCGGVTTPRQALEARCRLEYRPGCAITGDDVSDIAAAVAAARAADVAVVCVGGRSGAAPDCTSGASRDASDLHLTGVQSRLVAEVAATGTPLVLMVVGGRAFALPSEAAVCNAALMAWVPGQEGGEALARVLLGEADCGGRLPVTLPRSAGQVPVCYNHRSGGGRSLRLGDYTDLPVRPLFPFGHGLSYTTFEYQALTCPDTADVHATVNVELTVQNVGFPRRRRGCSALPSRQGGRRGAAGAAARRLRAPVAPRGPALPGEVRAGRESAWLL